jgi:hypothetical protein
LVQNPRPNDGYGRLVLASEALRVAFWELAKGQEPQGRALRARGPGHLVLGFLIPSCHIRMNSGFITWVNSAESLAR